MTALKISEKRERRPFNRHWEQPLKPWVLTPMAEPSSHAHTKPWLRDLRRHASSSPHCAQSPSLPRHPHSVVPTTVRSRSAIPYHHYSSSLDVNEPREGFFDHDAANLQWPPGARKPNRVSMAWTKFGLQSPVLPLVQLQPPPRKSTPSILKTIR